MQEKKKKARHTIPYNVSSRQVCSLGSISGAVTQSALATAFIEPPLAQTEVRGENRCGEGWGYFSQFVWPLMHSSLFSRRAQDV